LELKIDETNQKLKEIEKVKTETKDQYYQTEQRVTTLNDEL